MVHACEPVPLLQGSTGRERVHPDRVSEPEFPPKRRSGSVASGVHRGDRVMSYLALIEAKRRVAPGVRARVALDVVECLGRRTTLLDSVRGARVRLAEVQLDGSGRVENRRAIARALEGAAHPTTLFWEILAGREADTDELPWADPATDLPDAVLDAFASLAVRPATSIADLATRLTPALRAHAATAAETEAECNDRGAIATPVVPAPAQAAPITLRAPAKTADALRAMREEADHEEPAPRPSRANRDDDPASAGTTTQRLDAVVVQELLAASHAPTTTTVEPRDEHTPVPWLTSDPIDTAPKRGRSWALAGGALAAMAAVGALSWMGAARGHQPRPAMTPSIEAAAAPPSESAAPQSERSGSITTTAQARSEVLAAATSASAPPPHTAASTSGAPIATAPRPVLRGKLPHPVEPSAAASPSAPPSAAAPPPEAPAESLSRETIADPE